MGAMTSTVVHWSEERARGDKIFATVPPYPLAVRTSAWQWFQKNAVPTKNEEGRDILRLKNCSETIIGGNTHIYISAKGGPGVSKSSLIQRQRKFKSLEALQTHYYGIHEIIFNCDDWEASTCSCVPHLKHYSCKHDFAIACLKKLAKFDDVCKTIRVGHKRGPGRPKKTKANDALLRDDRPVKRVKGKRN